MIDLKYGFSYTSITSKNMRFPSDTHERIMSVYQLLQERAITVEAFEHIRTILKGLHPKVDEKLEICSKALDTLQKLQSGDIITLSAEKLSEDTEEKKKRKKALLLFIQSLKNLKSEIKRIDAEFTQANAHGNSLQNQLPAWGRIISPAKGPFGIVTLIALVIVGFLLLRQPQYHSAQVIPKITTSPTAVSNASIQVITYNGKQIPINQLYVGHGPDCNSPHYHAITGSVTALDGTVIPDPENCGYGKLKDVQITEVSVSTTP